jgi:peptidoglycan/LPS O-acetylase OafA/YrhL
VFGQVSVLIFFLLSGFVIYYSMMTRRPNMTWREYFMARFRRIFPIFILAMVTNYLLLCGANGIWAPFEPGQFFMNLLQVQDDNHYWYITLPYQNNHPLWSLAYEWWFYMLFFPLQYFMRDRPDLQKWVVAGFSGVNALLMLFFPNGMSMYFAYWVIWWAGVEMAREYIATGQVTLRKQWSHWSMVAGVAVLWLVVAGVGKYWMPDAIAPPPGTDARAMTNYPYLQVRHFLSVFLVLGFGYLWYKVGLQGYKYIILPFLPLAHFSYALYVVHLPYIHMSQVLSTGSIYLDMLVYIPATMLTAWIWERRMQPTFNKYLR